MKCPKCEAEVADNALYCHKCGERVAKPPESEADAPSEKPANPFPPPPAKSDPPAKSKDGLDSPLAAAELGSRPSQPASAMPPGASNQLRDKIAETTSGSDEQPAPDEILWKGSYSPRAMIINWLFTALVTVLLIALGIWVGRQDWLDGKIVCAITAGLTLLLWGIQVMVYLRRRLGVRYRLTPHRFFHEEGIIRHVTDTIEVIDMSDIKFEQNIWERLLGVGTIRIKSSDRSHPEFTIRGIENAREAFQIIDRARHDERMRRGVHIEHI